MGDRVIVTFTDNNGTFSPGVYMHWMGAEAAELIRQFQPVMRRDDASYAAARFCGECHKMMVSHLGLGLIDAPDADAVSADTIAWDEYSPGNAGVYVVNVSTGEVACYAGYGEGFAMDPEMFAQG